MSADIINFPPRQNRVDAELVVWRPDGNSWKVTYFELGMELEAAGPFASLREALIVASRRKDKVPGCRLTVDETGGILPSNTDWSVV